MKTIFLFPALPTNCTSRTRPEVHQTIPSVQKRGDPLSVAEKIEENRKRLLRTKRYIYSVDIRPDRLPTMA